MNIYNSIGERIRYMRVSQLKGQREVANALGISVPAYSKLETGITVINMARLKDVAEYFGVSPESLIVGKEIENSLVAENQALKAKLGESSEYCIVLQRKLIRCYELLDALKEKEHGGVLDLLG